MKIQGSRPAAVPEPLRLPVTVPVAPLASRARLDAFDASPPLRTDVPVTPGPSFFDLAALPNRRLPPLEEALARADILPLDPGTIPVPEDVLATLMKARRVLVVSHTPPDGDCVGSSLGLRRTLAALGKQVDVCIDDELPGNLRGLVKPGEVKRAAELSSQSYDAVVLVDIAIHKRVAGARALVENAKELVVLDHHERDPLPSGFNLRPDVKLHEWIEPAADAACLLSATVCAHLAGRGKLDASAWAEMAPPLLAGTLTDTGFFKQDGVALDSLRVFKHLLQERGKLSLDAVTSRLAYTVPECATGLLEVPPRFLGPLAGPEGAAIRERFRALAPDLLPAVKEGPGWVRLGCSREAVDLAVEAARLVDPQTSPNDVTGILKDRLDALAGTHEVAVLAYGSGAGVKASFRSKTPGVALELARGFGGGGHDVAAGATLDGAAFPDTVKNVDKALQDQAMKREAQLRVGH